MNSNIKRIKYWLQERWELEWEIGQREQLCVCDWEVVC